MWRNDTQRQLVDRVEHLLAKGDSYQALRWLWVVGDSDDGTGAALWDLIAGYRDVVRIVEQDTGITGRDGRSRLRRLSATANTYFRCAHGADYLLVHESDIRSPHDLVPRMVARAEGGLCPLAAWPVLEIAPGRRVFYDIWAFRRGGQRFSSYPPYHAVYTPNSPFPVDSFGTVFLVHGEDAPQIHMEEWAVLDLCRQLRAQGRTLWVDPTLVVEQPRDLWTPAVLEG
jgi:hypothetical protein